MNATIDIRTIGGLRSVRYDDCTLLIALVDVIVVLTGFTSTKSRAVLATIRKLRSWGNLIHPAYKFCAGPETPGGKWSVCRAIVDHLIARTTYTMESDKQMWRRRFCIPEPTLYTGINIRLVWGMENIRYDNVSGMASLVDMVAVITRVTIDGAQGKLRSLNKKLTQKLPKFQFPGGQQQSTPAGEWEICVLVANHIIKRSRCLGTSEKKIWLRRFMRENNDSNDNDDMLDDGGGDGDEKMVDSAVVVDIRDIEGMADTRCENGLASLIDIAIQLTGMHRGHGSEVVRNLDSKFRINSTKFKFNGTRQRPTPVGDLRMCLHVAKHIIRQSTKITLVEKEEWYRRFGFDVAEVGSAAEIGSVLAYAFREFSPIQNYKVLNHTVQLYIPDLNVVVESDDAHADQSPERQACICNSLGATWIRYNTRMAGFCISSVISEIGKCACCACVCVCVCIFVFCMVFRGVLMD